MARTGSRKKTSEVSKKFGNLGGLYRPVKGATDRLPMTTRHLAPHSECVDETGASFSPLDMDQHPMGAEVGYLEE